MTAHSSFPFDGYLGLETWDGFSKTECKVIGETPKRYRIEAIERMRLGGHQRWLQPGQTALVPKHAIRRTA